MKKNFCAIFLIMISLTILFAGCEKSIEKIKSEPILKESEYTVKIKSENLNTSAKVFFDAENRFHLIHSDENSPLFGMEEIYENGKTLFYFQDLFWEEKTSESGTSLVFFDFDLIFHSDPEKSEKQNPKNKEILLVNTPRDYYVKLHDKKAYDKQLKTLLYAEIENAESYE